MSEVNLKKVKYTSGTRILKIYLEGDLDIIDSRVAAGYNRLNLMYNSRNITGFWNVIICKRFKQIKSDIGVDAFAKYYPSIMNENPIELLSRKQKYILRFVKARFSEHHGNNNVHVTAHDIDKTIGQLNKS